MAQEEGISSRPVVISVIVTALIVLASVYATEAMFNSFANAEFDVKESSQETPDVQASNAAQLRELTKPDWIDQKKGVVRIPIDRAMELTVEKLANKPVGKSGK